MWQCFRCAINPVHKIAGLTFKKQETTHYVQERHTLFTPWFQQRAYMMVEYICFHIKKRVDNDCWQRIERRSIKNLTMCKDAVGNRFFCCELAAQFMCPLLIGKQVIR